MAEQMTKETGTCKNIQGSDVAQRIMYTILALTAVGFTVRLVFKLLGTNGENLFVRSLYAYVQPIVGIFEGIFSATTINSAETMAIFEPATWVAMVAIAMIAWVRFDKTEYPKHRKSE